MAVTTFTGVALPTPRPTGKASLVTWSAIPTGNTGTPAESGECADRSVQVNGTFGGSTVVIEGSNDGTNYVTLTDPAGAALSFTSAGFKQILQIARYMRPSVSGGSGASINVNLLIVSK